MTTTRIAMITLDCSEVSAEADFWRHALGYEQAAGDGESYAMLTTSAGPALGVGRIEDYEPPAWPNPHGSKQFHLDLAVEDVASEEQRLLGLGARLADPQPGETWRVLLSPAGHPFCLTDARSW